MALVHHKKAQIPIIIVGRVSEIKVSVLLGFQEFDRSFSDSMHASALKGMRRFLVPAIGYNFPKLFLSIVERGSMAEKQHLLFLQRQAEVDNVMAWNSNFLKNTCFCRLVIFILLKHS